MNENNITPDQTDNVDDEYDLDSLDDLDMEQPLAELKAFSSGFLKRELTFWAIRWIIGFGIIAAVVHYYPDWSWLWWAGAIVACITLTTLLLAHAFLKRKLAQTEQKITDLDRSWKEEEGS